MKVLWMTNVPVPYKVTFFNQLGKHCELTVLFEKQFSDERDVSWRRYRFENFTGICLRGVRTHTDSSLCPEVTKYLKKNAYDVVICSNFAFSTGMLAIERMRLRKIPYYLECDGGFPKDGKGFKERVKKHFISGAAGYFTTGESCTAYYKAYGAKEPFYPYPFTSVSASDLLEAPTSPEKKRELREKLELPEERIVLSVGSPIRRKGFDVLLTAAAELPKTVGVYFIGGAENEEYRQLIDKYGLTNAHFLGFKSPEELAGYYAAADVFVLPTRYDIWGLVVNEAMAKGLPVITTTKCGAGLELVENGVNGWLVEPEDPAALAEAIGKVLGAGEAMGERALEKIRGYTIEEMVRAHVERFERIAEENKGREREK